MAFLGQIQLCLVGYYLTLILKKMVPRIMFLFLGQDICHGYSKDTVIFSTLVADLFDMIFL